MKKLILYTKFITVFFFVVSCKKNEYHPVLTILPLQTATIAEDLRVFVDTLIFIPLINDSNNFISEVSKILIDNDTNLLLLDHVQGVQLVDQKGVFIRNIGTKGRGPGEYQNIEDLSISSNGEYLLILQQTGVLKYRISDGKFINKINLSGKNYDAICSSDDEGFFLFSSNPADESNFDKPFYALTHFDSKAKAKRELLPRKDFVFSQGIFTQSYDKSTIMRPQEGDNIAYKIGKEIIPFLKIDFKNSAIPPKYIFKDGGDLFEGMKNYLFSDYYKLPIHIHDTKDYIYFSSIGPSALQNDFVFSKSNNIGFRWVYERSDRDPLFIMASDSTYFYTVIYRDREDLKVKLSKNANLRDFIMYKLSQLPNSNHDAFIVKIKFCNNERS
jgi:hypothetical protein